ncbi:putative enzyme related to lactoylglutathione lyase [Actinomycetospora succinea]|uniref:Putative enzyme related to lactoylglutathione lyase n=1 Tax=Actinomycetospora succinea TaxID=663603 RepID=A0A4R6VNU8_9PSEU|nr:VOC family protein [Actinomycetospora succinea]TDQ65559.1 putative enzyme related to lactoylglutathione lyase [Actinomycetospora succinea]
MTGIARLQLTAIDTPDPRALAEFYATLVGLPIDESATDDDWIELNGGGGPTLAFQLAPAKRAPAWPEDGALQFHLDVEVDDLDTAEAAVLRAGATKTAHQPGTTFRVFLDPDGNPFCLVRSAVREADDRGAS